MRLTEFRRVGPVCSAGLRRHGLPVHLEPEHPKVGHLLVAVARQLGGRALSVTAAEPLRDGTGASSRTCECR